MVNEFYTIPGTTINFEKGVLIYIPTYSIHHDDEIYENPSNFDPNRFDENENLIKPYSYLPFGDNENDIVCLISSMLVKNILAELLATFKFSKCDKTPEALAFDDKSFATKMVSDCWLNVERI